MSRPGGLAWLAAHEGRLTWRDWVGWMTGGHKRSLRRVFFGLLGFAVGLHALALFIVWPMADKALHPDSQALAIFMMSFLAAWSMMLSQAMESVTRVFYTRSDLELILASPASSKKLFALRIAVAALSTAMSAFLIAGPFIDALAILSGPQWLASYGVVLAMGMTSVALAVMITIALFRLIGPKRTRLVAQIVAAVIGAAFVIGLQCATIFSSGQFSRYALLSSPEFIARLPAEGSAWWLPAHAMMGDALSITVLIGASAAVLGAVILAFAAHFGDHAVAAAGSTEGAGRQRKRRAFPKVGALQALRRKEWTLLKRDPWLISQTLLQVLYLIPPALLLYKDFSGPRSSGLVVIVPVLVMIAGQLSGGLAWLAISGEDAPDLVATAPVVPRQLLRAKTEAVLIGVGLAFAPFLLLLAFASARAALAALIGGFLAAGSAASIQLWFRSQARRSQFRRRQNASRVATFAEAFSSISWAAAAAVYAQGSPLWPALVVFAFLVLGIARWLSPSHASRSG